MTNTAPVSTPPAPLPPPPLRPAIRPWRLSKAPSVSRLFAVAFVAIAIAGLADRIAIWRSARRIQADMVELTQQLERLQRIAPSPTLDVQVAAMRELATDVGDDAIQTAAATTVIFVIVLVALGVGLWYNRGRLAAPFTHVMGALERVAAGQYDERLDEDQPEEFGLIARSVNRMAGALGWRERMQEHTARLLTALNAPPTEPGGGGGGGSFGRALDVLADATGAAALALYQANVDTNDW